MDNKIRLIYISLEKFNRYGTGEEKLGQTLGVSSPFKLPKGMSLTDACRFVSYLSEKVEQENNLEPACEKSVALVSHLLPQYGFEKIEAHTHGHFHAVAKYCPYRKITTIFSKKLDDVTDLMTVGGDFELFKKSDLYDRYFDWFFEGVTEKDTETICKNSSQKSTSKTKEKSL